MKTHLTLKAEVADEESPFAPAAIQPPASGPFTFRKWRAIILTLLVGACNVLAQFPYPGLQQQIPPSEYAALVNFYQNTGGPNWTNKAGWNDPQAITWSGVIVTGFQYYPPTGEVIKVGNVTTMGFNDNGLTGQIPAAITNLTKLKYLTLGYNQLSGPIPGFLGTLSELSSITLWGNQFSGPIPQSLGSLEHLDSLLLSQNQLTGSIPDSFSNLAQLRSLDLYHNQLTGSIPAFLGNLTKLTSLVLSKCQFSNSIPDSLGNLTNLQALDLSYNQLTGSIPAALGNLPLLQDLRLNDNRLGGILPTSLTNAFFAPYQRTDLQYNCFVVVPCPTCLSDPGMTNRAIIDQMIAVGKSVSFTQSQCVCLALSNDKLPEKWGPGWFANVIAVECSDGPTTTIVDQNIPVFLPNDEIEAFGVYFLNSLTNRFQFDANVQSTAYVTVSTPAFNGISAGLVIQITTNKPAGAPPLLNPVGTPGAPGTFSFSLTDMPGQTYLIQTTTNLHDWDSVRLITLPATGRSNVSDTLTPGEPQKFYRALLQ